MKLNVRALALASGTIASALFVLCALFVAVAPGATIWATRELFHVAVASAPSITWTGFVVGLIFWYILTAVTAAAWAALYNRWLNN